MSENTQHKKHWLGHKHVPGLLVNAKAKPQSESQKGGGGSHNKYYSEALCMPGPGRRGRWGHVSHLAWAGEDQRNYVLEAKSVQRLRDPKEPRMFSSV